MADVSLKQYQTILDQLAASANRVDAAVAKIEEQSAMLSTHDNDEKSHPYIQQMIKSINTVTPVDVQTALNTHNIASNTHEDIRSQLRNISNSVTTSSQIVAKAIEEHSASLTAHPDMRTTLSKFDNELLVVRNNAELISKLQTVFDAVGAGDSNTGGNTPPSGSIVESVANLESNVAGVQAKVIVHDGAITVLKETSDFLQDTQLTELRTVDANLSKRLSDLELLVAALEGNGSGGGGGGSIGDGVDLTGFECDIPKIVAHNKTYDVTFKGIIVPEGETAVCTINEGSSGFTFSKKEGIALGETIQVTIPQNAPAGIVKQFGVIVTLSVSGAASMLIFPTKINSYPKIASMVCSLQKLVEPGKKYTFKITGAADADGQVITYDIDPKTSTLQFTKIKDIAEGENVEVTIPADAIRGQLFEFDITAKDVLGEGTKRTMSGYKVNVIPNIITLNHNIPAIVKPGASYRVSFSGATTSDNSPITYSLTVAETPTSLTFAKVTGIQPSENVILFADDVTAMRGAVFNITITATDGYGASASVTTVTRVNQLPISTAITTTLPAESDGGTTLTNIKISGGSDADAGQSCTYNIVPVSSMLGFSKTTGISATDTLTVTVPIVMANTDMTFDIEAIDTIGEKSAAPKRILLKVLARTRTAAPAITYPQNGATNVPRGFNLEITPYTTELID